jgi:hypothetical protein
MVRATRLKKKTDVEECRRLEAQLIGFAMLRQNYVEVNKGVFDRIGLSAMGITARSL